MQLAVSSYAVNRVGSGMLGWTHRHGIGSCQFSKPDAGKSVSVVVYVWAARNLLAMGRMLQSGSMHLWHRFLLKVGRPQKAGSYYAALVVFTGSRIGTSKY